MNRTIRIQLVKSIIGRPRKHTDVVRGLGLSKINGTVELQDTPEVRGMINKISHMLKVVQL